MIQIRKITVQILDASRDQCQEVYQLFNYDDVNEFSKNICCPTPNDFFKEHCIKSDWLNDKCRVGQIQKLFRTHEHAFDGNNLSEIMRVRRNEHAAVIDHICNWNQFKLKRLHILLDGKRNIENITEKT